MNEKIKNLLESHFLEVFVEGEISRPTYHTSGHLYFSLKDKDSLIKCVMFRSLASRLKFRLEDGQKVIITGRVSVYKPRGEYQLYATSIEPYGAGALAIAFEQLKKKLESKGYFDKIYKKEIPKFVNSIAIVTSITSAALQDMLKIIKRRWPLVKVYLINSLVQGKEASFDIADSIKLADSLGVDVIIVGRGGGSLEDLWPFNEEVVADAIFEANTPIVSAVGHEIDFMISDFVADLRAPTPSAAIEMILPDKDEMLLYIDSLEEQMEKEIDRILRKKEEEIRYLYRSFEHISPIRKLEFYHKEVLTLKNELNNKIEFLIHKKEAIPKELYYQYEQNIKYLLTNKENIIEKLKEKFLTALESKKTKKGFAQIVKDKKVIDLEDLEVGDIFELETLKTKIEAKVLNKENIKQ